MDELAVELICPNPVSHIAITSLPVFCSKSYPLIPFDRIAIDFLDIFSKKILSDRSINLLPEMAALGFWLRKSNILQIIKENDSLQNSNKYKISPIGKALHICPANVDTMFIYSLAVSLLIGNKNILRISSRMDSNQVSRLFEILNAILNDNRFTLLKDYINIIRYNHSSEISNFLSSNVNARLIWGGDQTISQFKLFQTSPRTKDIAFADRVSILCIKCSTYLELNDSKIEKVISLFYNDAYTFDQKGCSSPQTIYFLGDDNTCNKCIKKFQYDLTNYLPSKYGNDINSLAALKFNRLIDDVIGNIIIQQQGNTYIKLLEISPSVDETALHSCGGGYFYYRRIKSINSLTIPVSPKLQTITHWGLSGDELNELIKLTNGEGIDRVVPLGEALNFGYIWDGYNLFDELSRKVRIV